MVNPRVDQLFEDKEIGSSVRDSLKNDNPPTTQIYILPKNQANDCPMEKTSQVADFSLQPLLPQIRSYLKNTTDFLWCLKELSLIPKDTPLVTMHVVSLDKNILFKEGIRSVKNNKESYQKLVPGKVFSQSVI